MTCFRDQLLCRWPCALLLALVLVASVNAGEPDPGPLALSHEGIALTPTTRAEEFAFARKPTLTTDSGKLCIQFATTAYCDVTIGIIRKRDGKIVRHLASGVLGKNAPEPFQQNSFEQTVVWDLKDDHKRYVDDLENYVIKVSLGLKPVFGKIIGWHPKDNTGYISAIGADEDGVYVLEHSKRPRITMYDHEGNYLRMVFPPAGNTPLSALVGLPRLEIPGEGREVLRYCGWGLSGYGCLFPLLQYRPGYQSLVVSQGRIAFCNNGYWHPKHILYYRTDGTTLDGIVVGPTITAKGLQLKDNCAMAASPDGKWLYVTNLGWRGPYPFEEHAVFRMSWDAEGPLPKDAFIGERKHPGDDNFYLNTPKDIACDRQGRIYVADTLNHRIQVFDAEGKHLKTIPVISPGGVGIHQETGEIYVVQQDKLLLKMGTFDNPCPGASWNLEHKDGEGEAEISKRPEVAQRLLSTVMCVDSWAKTPTIWISRVDKRPWPHQGGQVLLLLDGGDHFELKENFEQTVRQAGLFPHMFFGGKMPRVVVDPTREHVYYEGPPGFRTLHRFDTRTGEVEAVRMPYSAHEVTFGPNGLIYVRTLGVVGRFDPVAWCEVPFDFGVHIPMHWTSGFRRPVGGELIGGLKLADEPGAKTFQDGIGVSVSGEVSVLSNIYDPKELQKGTYIEAAGYERMVKLMQLMGYRPLRFPGRSQAGQSTAWVFTPRGEFKSKDVIPGLQVGSCGIQTDAKGNIYVGFAGTPAVAGKPYLPASGSVIKFPPTGGKLFGDWATRLPMKELPSRPPDFFVAPLHRSDIPVDRPKGVGRLLRREFFVPEARSYKIWAKGALWAYGGLSSMVTVKSGCCTCPNNRFSLDYYARSFIPETYRFSVGVCDTNGNLITHIGRYGNEDSRGPGSPVSVGGDEIAFAFPCFVSVKDGELYVSDSGNDRIVQVLLDYHVEETLGIPVSQP